MLTRSIDAAFDALASCRQRVPFLRDLYPVNSPERAALEGVIEAVTHADAVLTDVAAKAPPSRG